MTIFFCIAFGVGISGSSQTPSPKSLPDVSPTASPQTDLSGTYEGLLRYPQKGFYGGATLVITGDRFTFTIESTTLTGRIAASASSERVVLVFDNERPSSPFSIISVTAIREEKEIWLGSAGGNNEVDFYFGTTRLREKLGSGELIASTGTGEPTTPSRKPPMRAAAKPRRVSEVYSPGVGPDSSSPEEGPSPAANADTSIFSKLKGDANVVFTTPDAMKMEETKVIELLVSPSKSAEELKAELSEPGRSGSGSTRYSPQMEAQLTGTGFTITPITPPIQPVEMNHTTTWMWQIKPKDGGAQRLDLTLNAVVKDGKAMVRTFHRDININVSWTQKASGFIGPLKDLQWLWAVIIVPIAGAAYGWWVKRRKARRRKK